MILNPPLVVEGIYLSRFKTTGTFFIGLMAVDVVEFGSMDIEIQRLYKYA